MEKQTYTWGHFRDSLSCQHSSDLYFNPFLLFIILDHHGAPDSLYIENDEINEWLAVHSIVCRNCQIRRDKTLLEPKKIGRKYSLPIPKLKSLSRTPQLSINKRNSITIPYSKARTPPLPKPKQHLLITNLSLSNISKNNDTLN